MCARRGIDKRCFNYKNTKWIWTSKNPKSFSTSRCMDQFFFTPHMLSIPSSIRSGDQRQQLHFTWPSGELSKCWGALYNYTGVRRGNGHWWTNSGVVISNTQQKSSPERPSYTLQTVQPIGPAERLTLVDRGWEKGRIKIYSEYPAKLSSPFRADLYQGSREPTRN